MKKLICLFILAVAAQITAIAAPSPEPRATFDKIWVDYNVSEAGEKGMKIHLKFSTYGMKDVDSYVAVYFEYNDEVGGIVKDKNQKFYSTAGDAALYQSIKPAFDPADYNDLQLFMPYSELDLEPGEYDLRMDIKLIYKAGGAISALTKYDFEYTKPGCPTIDSGSWATAIFENMWVDYDVTENNQKGMRVHVKCSLKELKNIDCYLALYFEKKNGEVLKGTKTEFRSTSGQLAVYKSLKPAYDDAVYDDLQLFLPYSEFTLPKGRHDLKIQADMIYKNGDMIKHLNTHEFWFEK